MSKNGIKEAERIAKEIGGHIPERVEEDYIPNDEKLLLIPKPKGTVTIPIEKYEELVRDAGYYQGIAEGLEKQLEEAKKLNIPVEDIKKYYDEKLYIGAEITE